MKNFITFNTGRVYDFPQVIEAAIISTYICSVFESERLKVYFKDDSRGLDYTIDLDSQLFTEDSIMQCYDSNDHWMKHYPSNEDREVFEAIKEAQAI
jgi:hypothetical protein